MTPLLAVLLLARPDGLDVEALRKQIQSPEAARRQAVVEQLLFFSLDGAAKFPGELLADLLPLVNDPAAAVRKTTASLWIELGPRALPVLLEQMDGRDPGRRRAAAEVVPLIHKKLGKAEGRKAVQQLERLLFDPDAPTRAAAESSLRTLDALP